MSFTATWIDRDIITLSEVSQKDKCRMASLICGIQSEVKVKVTQLCPTLCDPMDYSPWNSLGQSTGVGSLSLLQGIFPTQELNQGLLKNPAGRFFTN